MKLCACVKARQKLRSFMAKNYSKRNRTRKSVIAMLCALSVTCTGLATACAPNNDEDDTSTAVTAKEDNQVLKNGNFEHFDIPDKAVHLIKNANNWSRGGDTSVKSGIISTAPSAWDELTANDLKEKLDYNNDLTSDNEEYVNYNSMYSRDLLYKDTYAGILDDDKVKDSYIDKFISLNGGKDGYEGYFNIKGDGTEGDPYMWERNPGEWVRVYKLENEFYLDEDFTQNVRSVLIKNPETHYGTVEKIDDKYYLMDTPGAEDKTLLYEDDNGNLYKDEDKKEPISNILMLHNSPTSTSGYNSIHQYFTSSTVTLEANTSAKISLWVKTSDLKFDKGYNANDDENKGAYIEVLQTVSGSSIDSFKIQGINTEKIIDGAKNDNVELSVAESNGWLQYNIFVNSSDFASSTVQLRLGLGGSEQDEKVTGYAFFDDVVVEKYRSLDKCDAYTADVQSEISTNKTAINLTTKEENKIFYADEITRSKVNDKHAYHFNYLVDLTSDTGSGNVYQGVSFDTNNVSAGLTTEKDSQGNVYSVSLTNDAKLNDLAENDKALLSGVRLPTKASAIPTDSDLIGIYNLDHKFVEGDFNSDGSTYAELLNKSINEKQLPAEYANGNMLVMLSAWGAPYTATIDNSFTVGGENKDGYQIVSFWVKTSEEKNDGASIKIYEVDAKGNVIENSVQTLSLSTAGNEVDFENEKDIYNGWVQYFFFVKNDTKEAKTFKLDFTYGNSSVISNPSRLGGWAVIAGMRTLEVDEDIFKLASSGSNTGVFTFYDEDEDKSGNVMDEADSHDLKKEISTPINYTGKNGTSSNGSHAYAGVINKDNAETYDSWDKISTSFIGSVSTWDNVFGEKCYQPLIIINDGLRTYADKATATEETYQEYYVLAGVTETEGVTEVNGKKYKKADKWDEKQTYYSIKEVFNYGFVGNSKTVSSSTTETVSVRVKVTGNATAYIYLVDDDGEVMSYTTPAYTFYYDDEGNVLNTEFDENWKDKEHREHIVYTLRDDGLYEDKDGKVFANLHNLKKLFDADKYAHNEFYDAEGNSVSFFKLKDGVDYYKDKNGTLADHYLVNSKGEKIYEYVDGKTYYVENDETTTEVTNFDTDIARYEYPSLDEKLMVTVNATDCERLGKDGWVTVNFVIQTGVDSKSYHLELWNGARNEDGNTENNGAVAFDYSGHSVSSERLEQYEDEIIRAYYDAISAKANDDSVFAEVKDNIASYEKLAETVLTEDEVKAIKATYTAYYYNFTWYDSEAYIPFNANTAEDGETGYDLDAISLFNEKLAYFEYEDKSLNSVNVFADYSAVDQKIDLNTNTDEDDEEEEETASSTELGLYISSIVLVVVLLVTLISIGVTQLIKNMRKKNGVKNSNKNAYRKRDRYIKKLHLVKNADEVESVDGQPAEDTTEVSEENDGDNN